VEERAFNVISNPCRGPLILPELRSWSSSCALARRVSLGATLLRARSSSPARLCFSTCAKKISTSCTLVTDPFSRRDCSSVAVANNGLTPCIVVGIGICEELEVVKKGEPMNLKLLAKEAEELRPEALAAKRNGANNACTNVDILFIA